MEKIYEVNLIKFAFAEAIEAKQKTILKIMDKEKLDSVLGFHAQKGMKRNVGKLPYTIEDIKNQIKFLLECHDKAEDIRIKMTDQRAEAFAKQYKKGRKKYGSN